MIEYLEKLVEDKEYQKALDYAEQLLLDRENKQWDLMVIYSFVLQARFEIGEVYGAQVAGQLSANMARELEAWDYFGKATLWLGVCYIRLRQPENAINTWYDYLAHVHLYKEAAKHHTMVLYNIGFTHVQIGNFDEGIQMLQRAEAVATSCGDYRGAHGIRHALIDTYLRHNQLQHIPMLLARCASFLRSNLKIADYQQSKLWHLILRVRYAVATNRPHRVLRVAGKGLRMVGDMPHLAYYFHQSLARAYEQLGDLRSALEEGIRARGVAIGARRFELEYEIASYIYALLSDHPDLTEQFGTTSELSWDPSAE